MHAFRTYEPRHMAYDGKEIYPTCPQCWVKGSKVAALHSIPSNTDEDVFRCGACNSEFVVP